MGLKKMKGIVTDLDDTLLRDDLTISDYTVSVLRRLHASGIIVIVASGRAKLSMKPYIDRLGCVSVYISCNGAEIWNGSTDALICRELFSAELTKDIIAFGEAYGCYTQIYEGDSFFFNQQGEYASRYASSSRLRGTFVPDLIGFVREPRNKVLMMADEAKIAMMLGIAKKQFAGQASVTCSKPYYLEFNPVKATKGLALSTAARHLGISEKEITAYGDSLNDLSMLQAAGTAVMVENGWDEIRPYCSRICASNNLDGPAHDMEIYFLQKEAIL